MISSKNLSLSLMSVLKGAHEKFMDTLNNCVDVSDDMLDAIYEIWVSHYNDISDDLIKLSKKEI